MSPSPRIKSHRAIASSPRFPAYFALVLLAAVPPPAYSGALCPEYVGTVAKEVASADFDQDGLADFAVTVEPNAVAIVLGRSGPRPTELLQTIPTGGAVFGIAAGDLNQDGIADLVVASPAGGYARVLLANGDGSFAFGDPTDSGSDPWWVALADTDGDGDRDVAFLRSSLAGLPPAVTVRANAGDGTFGPAVTFELAGLPPASHADLAAGDLDGDGDAEVVVSGTGFFSGAVAAGFAILRANGDGTFAAPEYLMTGISTGAIAIGDVTGDGIGDLVSRDGYVAIGGPLPNRMAVYPGTLGGSLGAPIVSTVPTVAWGHGRLRLADLDRDGDLDAVVAAGPAFPLTAVGASGIGTLLGDGAGGFVATQVLATGSTGTLALALGDANGDGYLDAATVGGEYGTLYLNPGSPGGTFTTLVNEARAFVDKNNETIRLNSNKPNWCVSFEPANGSIDLLTETPYPWLVSEGTGSVSQIGPDSQKGVVIGDSDGNDVPDIRVCYAKDRLRQLFSDVTGRQSLLLKLRAEIGSPPFSQACLAEATIAIDVIAGGGNNAAVARPELGGGWTLSYRSDRPDPARIRVFDVAGRLVRSLQPVGSAAGWNEVRIDGRDDAGRALGSGIYFYRIDGAGEPVTGRLVLAR